MTPSSRSPAQVRGQAAPDDAADDGSTATAPGSASGSSVGATKSGAAPLHSSTDRLRLLSIAAVLSVFLSYVLMVLVAGLAGLTAGEGLAPRALLVAAIPLWLAAHQVPLVVAGAPLGVLPLVPTAAVLALTALTAMRVTRRLGSRLREDASAVVATLAGAHASVAVLATALPQSPVQAAPWAALLGAGLVAAAGAGLGALRCTGLPPWWYAAPIWVRGGIGAARIGAAALATEGALMLLSALLVSIGEVYARVQSASPSLGAGVGITLLSLCYLPNALVASVSWVAGPGLSIGAAAASPLFTAPGLVPPIPLMAAMPALQPPAWTVVVFLLPVLAGALVGRRCREVDAEPMHRLAAVGVATVTVAVGFALLAAVVGGRLAAGPFDPVDLPALALAGALLGWIGVPAVAVVLLPTRVRRPRLPKPGRRTRSSRQMGRRTGRRGVRAGAAAAGAAGTGTLAGAASTEESEYEDTNSEDSNSEDTDSEDANSAAGDSDYDDADFANGEYDETEYENDTEYDSGTEYVNQTEHDNQTEHEDEPEPLPTAPRAGDYDSDLGEFEFDELELDEFELGTFDSQLASANSDHAETGWRRAPTDVEPADGGAETPDQGTEGPDLDAEGADAEPEPDEAMAEGSEPETGGNTDRRARWWRRRRG